MEVVQYNQKKILLESERCTIITTPEDFYLDYKDNGRCARIAFKCDKDHETKLDCNSLIERLASKKPMCVQCETGEPQKDELSIEERSTILNKQALSIIAECESLRTELLLHDHSEDLSRAIEYL